MTPVDGSCTQFNRCSNGYLTVDTCPDGLAFDTPMKACNYADQVTCTSTSVTDPVGTGTNKTIFF